LIFSDPFAASLVRSVAKESPGHILLKIQGNTDAYSDPIEFRSKRKKNPF
jgi:hypothetical protein